MCSVSFHGESAGSIGYLDKVSSRGGESAGSIVGTAYAGTYYFSVSDPWSFERIFSGA